MWFLVKPSLGLMRGGSVGLFTALKSASLYHNHSAMGVLKKKLSMTLVKDDKADFVHGRLLQWGFVVGKRDWTQF